MYKQTVSRIRTVIFGAAHNLIGRGKQQASLIKIIIALTIFYFSADFGCIGDLVKTRDERFGGELHLDIVMNTVDY